MKLFLPAVEVILIDGGKAAADLVQDATPTRMIVTPLPMNFLAKRLGSIAVASAFLLGGCAVQTPYQSAGLTGGFKETRINDTTYQVRFFGNGNTSGDKIWYYWIYRCAELTKAKGYTGFVLISDKPVAPKTSSADDPISSDMKATIAPDGDESGFAGATGSGYYYVPSYGGGSITKYSASAFVHFLKEPIPENYSYYRAQTILDTLKPYINSEGQSKPPARVDIVKQALIVGKINAPGELPSSAGNSTLDDFKALLPGSK